MKKYKYIIDTMSQRIADGTYPANASLPTHQELCEEFATSRSQLHRVLGMLEEKKLITRNRGKSGTVNPPPRRKTMLYLFFAATPGYPITQEGSSERLYHGLDRFSAEYGYDLMVQSGENFLRSGMINAQVDAVMAGGSDVDLYIDLLVSQRLPLLIYGPYHMLDCDTFMPDYYDVGERSAATVLKKGFQRPLFVTFQYERQNYVLSAYRKMYHSFNDYFERFDRKIQPEYAVLPHQEVLRPGDGLAALNRKIAEFHPDIVVYSENILYEPLMKMEPFANLPALVCDIPRVSSTRVLEYTGVDLEQLGFAAGMRLHERIQQPNLPPLRRLFPVNSPTKV